jgi:AcrR family transcriptional regulator
MPRWESDAKGRLERAALDLFETQGFERTSVAQIASAAGLKERSFYRYFPDKREVLFAGNELEAHLVAQVEAAAPDLSPIEALLSALATAEEIFRSRELLLRYVAVIAANPALAERDLIKLADIADALALALERRGGDPPARHVPLAHRPGGHLLGTRRPDRHRTARGDLAAVFDIPLTGTVAARGAGVRARTRLRAESGIMTSAKNPGDGQPKYADRAYRSVPGVCGGVLLLALAGWLGGDAVARGTGHTPWLALAALLCAVPLIIAFSVRPAVFANDDQVRIRNPLRTVTVPWAGVDSVRAAYSTELVAGGRKFQLWAIPVSLRSRKSAARQTARARAGERRDPFAAMPRRRPGAADDDGTVRAWSDRAVAELRELSDRHQAEEADRPAPVIRWCYEVMAPAAAGAVVLIVLAAMG